MGSQPNQSNDRPLQGSVFHRLKQQLSKPFKPKPPIKVIRIVPSEAGFDVHDSHHLLWSIRWDDVVRVVAFKLDRISYDTICFGFQSQGEINRLWCIEEEWDGYKDILPEIKRLTKGGWPDKFAQVAHPAFEFNWKIIWEDPDALPLVEEPLLIWLSPPECTDPIG